MPYDNNCKDCPYFSQKHLHQNQKTIRSCPPIEIESNGSQTLLVFQAPGEEEWKIGSAIQPIKKSGGTAGRRIELSWQRSKKQRSDFDITNAVQCYPGKDTKRDFIPDSKSISACSKRLENILQHKIYRKIIVFGEISKQVINDIHRKHALCATIVTARHPNGGTSSAELDNLW